MIKVNLSFSVSFRIFSLIMLSHFFFFLKKGTHKIEAIMMNSHEKQKVQWSGDAFKKMPKLRMLVIRNALFSTGLTYLPNSLRVLEWIEYPSPSLPEDFHAKKLGVLCLPHSHFTKLKPFKV